MAVIVRVNGTEIRKFRATEITAIAFQAEMANCVASKSAIG